VQRGPPTLRAIEISFLARREAHLSHTARITTRGFNRRDWDGVRELISADLRLNVADRFAGKFMEAPYFFNHDRWPWPWKLALGELNVLLICHHLDGWGDRRAISLSLSLTYGSDESRDCDRRAA